MPRSNSTRVGYVLMMYPLPEDRAAVKALLAHEAAGTEIELFSLRASGDGLVDAALEYSGAPVTYLPYEQLRAETLWDELQIVTALLPGCWPALAEALHEDVRDVYQAALLTRLVCMRSITHLHAHSAHTATTVARLAARLAGIPFSFTVRADDLKAVRSADLRRKLDDAAATTADSATTVELLRATYGPAADHVEYVGRGLDLRQRAYHPPVARPGVASRWHKRQS